MHGRGRRGLNAWKGKEMVKCMGGEGEGVWEGKERVNAWEEEERVKCIEFFFIAVFFHVV